MPRARPRARSATARNSICCSSSRFLATASRQEPSFSNSSERRSGTMLGSRTRTESELDTLLPPPQPSPTRGEGAFFLPPPLWGRVGVGGIVPTLPVPSVTLGQFCCQNRQAHPH